MRKSLSLLMNRRFLARYYDPYRILINQIIRLFSGSLPRLVFGLAWGSWLGHGCLVAGLFMNISNAYIKFNSFWLEKRGQRVYFLPYFLLTATVFMLSGSSLVRFMLGKGGLMLTASIPTAVFSGTLQLLAEVFDLLCLRISLTPKHYDTFIKKLIQQSDIPYNSTPSVTKPNLVEYQTKLPRIQHQLAQKFRHDLELYRRKIVMAICLSSVTGIAWLSIFYAPWIMQHSPFAPLALTACGLSFAMFNFLAGKACLTNYFSPTNSSLARIYNQCILRPGYNQPRLQLCAPEAEHFDKPKTPLPDTPHTFKDTHNASLLPNNKLTRISPSNKKIPSNSKETVLEPLVQ